MIPLSKTTIRNPVIAWRNEMRPGELPRPEPPGVPFIVTRSEVVITPQGTTVHIWFGAPEPVKPGR